MSYAIDQFICEQLENEDFMDTVFDYTDDIQSCIDAHDQSVKESSVSYKLFTEELDTNV